MHPKDLLKEYINYGLLVLIFVIPLLFDPFNVDSFELPKVIFLEIVLIILVGLGGIYYFLLLKEERKDFFSPLIFSLPMCVFLISFIISFLFSQDKIAALLGTYKRDEGFTTILYYFLLYEITARFFSKNNFKILAGLLFLAAFLTSLYGLLQHFGIDPLTKRQWERAFSTLNHPNFLAAFLAMSFPFALYIMFFISNNENNFSFIFFISLLGIAIIFAALLFTYSRAGWIATALTIVSFLLLIRNKFKKKTFTIKIASVFIIFILISILVSITGKKAVNFTLSQRATSAFNPNDKTAVSRFSMWRSSLYIIKNFPLLGCGVDNYRLLFPQYKEKNYTRYEDLHITADKSHNEFLHLGATLGLLGILGYLLVLFTFLLLLKKYFFTQNNLEIKVVVCGILAYFIQVFFGFSVIASGSFLFFLFGVLEALSRKNHNPKQITKIERKKLKFRKKFSLNIPLSFIVIYVCWAIFNFYFIYKIYAAERYFSKGNILFNMKKYADSTYFLEKATEYNPFSENYFIKLGEDYEEIGKQDFKYFELARRAYTKAKDLHPLNAYNYSKIAKAIVLISKRDNNNELLQTALNLVKIASKLDPYNPVFLNNQGAILNDLNRSQEAEKYLREALKLDDNYFLAHHNLALALSLQKKYAASCKEYKIAYNLDKTNPLTLKGLVICSFNLKKYKNAKNYLNKLLEIAPENDWTKKTENLLKRNLKK